MLRGRFETAGELTQSELREAYDSRLAETIETVGVERVVTETVIDRERIDALRDGGSPDLSLEEAMAILGTDDTLPDAETLTAEARDILLMGMSMAVLDVEAIAAGIDDELDPKEIQQKVEGRYPITLDEYALLHRYIESQKR
jgi:hypothetical protein